LVIDVRELTYVNTSVIVASIYPSDPNHGYAVRFLEEVCLGRKLCRVSNLLLEEVRSTPSEETAFDALNRFGIPIIEVDIEEYLRRARSVVESLGFSYSRLIDVAHVLIARDVGCSIVASFDRKMLRFARRIGLKAYNPRYGWV